LLSVDCDRPESLGEGGPFDALASELADRGGPMNAAN